MKEKIKNNKEEIKTKKKRIKELEEIINNNKEEIKKKNKIIKLLEENINNKEEIEQKNQRIKELEENINNKEEIEQKNKRIKELEEIINNKEGEMEQKNKRIKELEENINNKEGEIERNNKMIEKITNDNAVEVEKIKNNIKDMKNEIEQKNKRIIELNSQIKQSNNQYCKIKEENDLISVKFSQLKIDLMNEKNKNEEITKHFENNNDFYKNEMKFLEKKIEAIRNILDEKKSNNNIKDTFVNNKINGIVGLKNEEYNCYMNSVIQILKNIKEFQQFILYSKGPEKQDNIFQSLKKLLNDLCYSNEKSISIREFKKYFSQKFTRFQGKVNNDSTYFLIYLLDYLHKIFNKPKNNITKIDNFIHLKLEKQEKDELAKFLKKYESKNGSKIQDLFYGYQMNKIICGGCGSVSISFQSFNILDIPLMDEKTINKSLEQCLNSYLLTKDQNGVKGFECSKCQTFLSHQISIIKLPPVLFINLKRVGENEVYYHEINIPFYLQTTNVEKLKNFNSKYELIGFIKHYGNEEEGHNIAYSKNIFNNKWYKFNDSIIEEVNNNLKTDKSFLLLYQLNETN